MTMQEKAADFVRVGGSNSKAKAHSNNNENAAKHKEKFNIAETIGALNFIVDNLDCAAAEAAIAANAISDKNIVAGHYHCARFAAYARAATKTFREILGPADIGGAND